MTPMNAIAVGSQGALVSATLSATTHSWTMGNSLLALSSILYALLLVSITGVLLGWKVVRQRFGLLVPVYVLLSLVWTLAQLALRLKWPGLLPADLLAWLLLYSLIPLGLLFLDLTRQFLKLEQLRWQTWVLGLVWLVVVAVLKEDPLTAIGLSLSGLLSPLARQWLAWSLLAAGWAASLAGAAGLCLRQVRLDPEAVERSRVTWWLLCLALTAGGGALFLIGYRGMGSVLNLLGTLGVTYLLAAQSAPDVRGLVLEALSRAAVTLLAFILFTATFFLGLYAMETNPGLPAWVPALILGLILAVLIHPLLDWARSRLVADVPPEEPNHNLSLDEYRVLISGSIELKDLAIVSLSLIREAMRARRGAFFVVERGEDWAEALDKDPCPPTKAGQIQLRVAADSGQDSAPLWLSPDTPFVEWLTREQHPITQSDLELQPRFQTMAAHERDQLSRLALEVYVPICIEDQWIGLVALGSRSSGEPYAAGDLDLLQRLAAETAPVLHSARLLSTLRACQARDQRLVEELAAANHRLRQLGSDQMALFPIAAGELQTRLASVRGYLELLHELACNGSLTARRVEETVHSLRGAVAHLDELAATLHQVSAQDSDPPELQIESVSLAGLVRTAAAQWRPSLVQRKQHLSTQGLAELPELAADGPRLVEALVELIQNAIKFTPNGGQIQVRGSFREGGPDRSPAVELVVADTGLGIARANLERVLEPFYRAGTVTLDRSEQTRFLAAGPGLGLTRVRRIVEAHGGRVWAVSPGYDEGNCPGTEMHVLLPLRNEA